MRKTLLLLFLAALGTSACASTGASSPSRSQSDVLARAEIAESPQSNAFDLVRQVRPRWLRSRGPNSINNNQPLSVYVDGVRMGGPQALSTIPTMVVESMRYLRPADAQTRFGLNNTQGAIAVTTRTR